jgi:hypothetical protein
VPARPAARRLAASLRGCDVRAWATGQLAFVALPDDGDEAAAAATRANRALGASPCVLVLAGPRPAAVEELLGLQDGVIIVAPGEEAGPLTALAGSGFVAQGLEAGVLAAPLGGLARLGAITGLALTPRARRLMTGLVGERW